MLDVPWQLDQLLSVLLTLIMDGLWNSLHKEIYIFYFMKEIWKSDLTKNKLKDVTISC